MYEVRSPVLLIVFNRPDHTAAILEVLRVVRPKRLYVAADAPRPKVAEDVRRCAETLALFDHLEWCVVKRKVNDANLGSHTTIPNAVDWFFESETSGIVLEDDCVPNVSFFRYCDELLEKYESDERIMWINGSNVGYSVEDDALTYQFSVYPISWGWASWRRAWSKFDQRSRPLHGISEDALARNAGHSLLGRLYWKLILEYAYTHKNWDYRWIYACWLNNGLACTPLTNMITNVGFGPDAVHCRRKDDPRGYIPTSEVIGRIAGPKRVAPSQKLDRYLDTALYGISLWSILRVFVASKFPRLRNFRRRFQGRQI